MQRDNNTLALFSYFPETLLKFLRKHITINTHENNKKVTYFYFYDKTTIHRKEEKKMQNVSPLVQQLKKGVTTFNYNFS